MAPGTPKPQKEDSKRFQLPTRSIHGALIAGVLALAVFRFFIQDAGDRHHCKSLLNDGRWLDDKHTSWQPDGCMLHPYKAKEVTQCLEGKSVVFIGDSTVRQVFYATVKHIDKDVDTKAEKHSDRTLTAGGVHFNFYWDPFLNGTHAQQLFDGRLGSATGDGMPTLAVVGSGIWYLRHTESGGIQTWDRQMERLFQAVKPSLPPIADEVILLPVENAIESRLSAERAATVHGEDIQKMNDRIRIRLNAADSEGPAPGASGGGLAVPRAFNKIIDGLDDETVDGLHFSDTISKVQASILLNLRCNDALPKKFPFDKTCCFQYPTPNWVQIALLVVLLMYGPLGLYFHNQPSTQPGVFRFFPDQKYLMPFTVFGFSVAFLFVADRTNLFLKENKQYDPIAFTVMCLAALAAGVVTLKPPEKDLGFLNREQTDEWKGWMQIAILIYHYVGASKISGIYNPIRVLVAAYLFMSGYGHLSFFLKKADFGFARVANIMIRLNLLTVVLAYLMDTDYLSYYFSPLVTIWFGIIWVTLWLGHKHNDKPAFLLSKLVVAAALTAVFFEIPGPLEKTFELINTVFATNWNAGEWRFRQTLDMWIVWVGMLTAYAFIKIKEYRVPDDPRWPQWVQWTTIASGLTMAGYFVFELTRESKFVYNAYHPYVSILPVLAWCVLRNATPWLRSTSSKFFIFFGQCSLETFILQFHLFIAGDTRGIIMMIPGGAWLRPINFIITSLIFVFVSNQVAIATGVLTAMICYVPKPPSSSGARLPTASRDAIPSVPPSATVASSHPASGEYVALSTVGDGPSENGQSHPNGAAADGLASLDAAHARGENGALHKVARVLATDLRVRFVAIFAGLWVLNVVYPA
ncbi:hypothetical protein Rhopal_007710-T1 [Rhodotorula paludigena]|uniref:Cas1p 10 TM acyl transferase domain-containing protein n=1 Tax=Rhodotorula paludigena TaxID=86838 RepID=A0AAV5H070_9BASI|nr:hypothetical protein Rhopal_007710-T1 [Rhodotorula paludigena]